MKQLAKASVLLDENINVLHLDEELIELEFTSETDPKKKYLVSCWGGIWRCSCEDFQFKGVNIEIGSYCCKHLIKSFLCLNNIKKAEIESDEFKTADKVVGNNGC